MVCGQAPHFGGKIQAVLVRTAAGRGLGVEPGSVHDLAAAGTYALGARSAAGRGLPTLADGGYDGAGHSIYIPVEHPASGRPRPVGNQAYYCNSTWF